MSPRRGEGTFVREIIKSDAGASNYIFQLDPSQSHDHQALVRRNVEIRAARIDAGCRIRAMTVALNRNM